MPENIHPASTTLPTGSDPLVGLTTGGTAPVNVAPSSGLQQNSTASQGSSADPTLIASYEMRIRNLMSEKDKAIAEKAKAIEERNQAISQQTEIQALYTNLQEQSSSNLGSAAEAAQQAINQVRQLQAEKEQLQAELRRAQVLQQFPELIPYGKFIPVHGTEDEQRKAVEELKAIREQDLKQIAGNRPPFVSNPTTPTGSPALPSGQPSISPVQALYGNRPTMNPFLPASQMPGSTPAAINPAGAGSTADAINKLLSEARSSGDPAKFEAALEQAKLMANQNVAETLGR